jgi:hypothetical protein
MQINSYAVKDTVTPLVGSSVYDINGKEHKIVAIYSGQTSSGGGVRLVNQDGERLDPKSSPLYTDIVDIAAKIVANGKMELANLESQVKSYENRIAELLSGKDALLTKIDNAQSALTAVPSEAVPA